MKRTGTLALLVALLVVTRLEAQAMRHVMSFPREYDSSVTIDDTGSAIYAVSSTNQFGTNPEYLKQIVRWDAVTGAGTPMTDFEEGVESVSVSDDGNWLAFVTRADLLGANHDESPELFVMHPDGTGLAQLTSESFLPLSDRGVRGAIISGSANRIAFVGRMNPFGTNPRYRSALFVIDRDGSNLKQLALDDVVLAWEIASTGYRPGPGLDISDDGSRIVYITGGHEIAGINANGTGRHVFSSTTGAADVVISGNGAKIAYATGGLMTHAVRTRSFDGNPFTIFFLSNGESPAITDDATIVYLYRYESASTIAGIWKMPATGGGPATLIATGLQIARLSGNGNRIAARGAELLATDGAGGSVRQLTTTTVFGESSDDVAFAPDASALYFSSKMDPLGTNAARNYEQFALSIATGQFTQLTDASLPPIPQPSFSDTGQIVFASNADLTGQNACGFSQIFRLIPGVLLSQLTTCSPQDSWNRYPAVRGDGELVAYFADNANGTAQVFSIHGDGSGRTQLTPNLGNALIGLDVGSTSPMWIAYSGLSNGSWEVHRVRSDGTSLQQITASQGVLSPPTISGDGERLAWISSADYTGENPDHSPAAFAYDAPTGTIRQLIDDVPDYPIPQVTRDGHYVFLRDSRYDMTNSTLEPAAGSLLSAQLYPDASGTRWLILVYDRLDNDPAYTAYYLADMTAVPAFTVGKASPTVLSWDPSPTSLRYDVIRGSIADLSIAGSAVSLGPVSCLEDESPDSHTRGYGDSIDPAPGQAFFFLYRGSVGFAAAPGSYGQGTGGKERLPASGDCGL
jgi:Tol biopolymer transport system component